MSVMDGFCNTSFWNSSASWDTELPSVSPCFRHTALVWLPCSVAWCLALFEGWSLGQCSSHAFPFSGLYISKLVFLALTFAVCTTKLVVSSLLYLQHETDLAEVAGVSVVLCTLVLVMALTMWARWKGLRSSVAIPTFWLIFACCTAITCYADIVDFNYDGQNIGVFCNFCLVPLTVIQLVLTSLSEEPPPYTALDADMHYCVLKEWTVIPRIFFTYMWRIVLLGYRDKLDVTTLLRLCTDLKCATAFKAFHRAAFKKPQQLRTLVDEHGSAVRTRQPQAKQPSLYWVVFRVCWFHVLASTVLETVGVFVSFLPPLMLSLILTFVQSNEYTWHGYVYAFGYAGFLFLSGVLDAHAVYFTEFAAFRAQSSLVAALYRKVFRLAPSARRQYMAGDVMNLMSVDVEEVSTFLTLSTQVWTVPLRIALTLWLLWRYLGASCLATVGVMFIAVLATTYVATLCDHFQEKQMALKDKRLRQISEILNGIKVLKLSGWEIPFMERVQQTRLQEVSYLKKFSLLDSVFGFLWTCAPYLAALASFGTFLAVNPTKRLTPEIAFVSLSLFSLMRFPMGILPDVISKFIRFLVSMGRLAKFLNQAELDLEAVGGNPEQGDSVTLKNATLSWSRQESPVLKNISLNFKTGSLVAVVGSVGSGKSSLLSAILGTLEKISGSIDVQGRVAYVPQQCWIQNATVKGNIVFTNPLDEERYQQVVEGCALLPDLEMLPGGESTEIGEKGINLSGGQKLRLSLARAVYHNADVYLLDDPFSAVDVHVAAHLFEHVVGPTGILNSKTRILVTHSVTYLPQVDWIVLLNQGVVQEQGTYEDLVAREGSEFAAFLQQHVKAHPSSNNLAAAANSNDSKDKQADQSTGRSMADKCNLTEEETVCTGYVGRRVYGAYFKKVGWHFLIPAFITCCLTFGSEYGSAAWLSKWSQDADASRKHFYLIGYGLFLISYVVFNFVFWIIFVVGTLRAAVWFHNQLLHSIMRSPLSFFDTTPMGRVVNRFSRDIESVDKEVPINANLTMCNIVWGMQLLILICIMSPYFTIVVIIAVCLFASITIVSLPAFRHVQRLRSVTRSPILSHISESIAGVVSVRAFGATKQFINTLERHVDNNINCCYHSLALDCCRLVIANTLALVVSLGASLLTVTGRGSLSPGMVGLVLSYTLEVSNAASYTFRMFALLETSLVAVERIKEYIGLAEEAPWRNTETQPAAEWPSRGDVVYSNYSAAYRDDLEMVLKGINIEAYDGQKIGLVGRTGAGKSTLALALFRIIEPKTGTIDVDSVDIAKIGLHDLRSKMTIIPQDPVLFAGTLRWNLDPCAEYSDEALWQALEQAHLKEFVATQDAGLDYEVLEGGENLSAGQKQLVCLTRALLRKCKVLVLDEATSSVDLATDHLVKETIHREFRDTTVITIAHRLHTIMDCDRILVLSAGEIVEEGSPSELLKKEDGLFLGMARDAGLA